MLFRRCSICSIRSIAVVEVPNYITPPEPQSVAIISQPKPAVIVPQITPQPVLQGDESPKKPGQDTVTQRAQSNVEAKPNYLKNLEPIYHGLARRHLQEGVILLAVRVTPESHAERVEIKKSSGSAVLDNAALQAVREWEFQPGDVTTFRNSAYGIRQNSFVKLMMFQ